MGESESGARTASSPATGSDTGSEASGNLFLFPGQGSQSLGMGRHLWETFTDARATFAEAEDYLGWDLRGLCMHGPLEELTRTDRAQPAIFVTGAAAMRVLRARGVRFGTALGHSLGEYTALVATGHMTFADALRVVAARGEAMYHCGRRQAGTMAAIVGLDDQTVEEICRQIESVWPANYNTPGQVVVSGTPEAVRRAMDAAAQRGARRVMALQVSGAFHSPLVAGAAEELRTVLDEVQIGEGGSGSFFSTTEVRYPDRSELRELLLRQLTSPVRFSQSLQVVLEGAEAGVEVGPGGVLAGLVKRVSRRFPVHLTDDAAALEGAVESLAGR